MPRLPDGTVTFLFTDIEKSTGWLQRYPEVMPAATERHFELIEGEVARYGGWTFKRVGDECCTVFRSPAGAFAAALSAQAALTAEPWGARASGFGPLKVRMALHTGEARRLGSEYHGVALSVVARLMDFADGGQMALSEDVAQTVAPALPEDVTLVDLGLVPLRGLRQVVRLYGVLGPGLEPVMPPTHGAVVVTDETVDPAPEEVLAAGIEAAVRTGAPARMSSADLRRLLVRRPSDLTAYRVGRVAEWTQGQHELDRRFVHLRLLVDRGEAAGSERWEQAEREYDDLGVLLGEVPDPALVVLGAPGCGKTTLLRRLELDLARGGLLGGTDAVSFLLPMSGYRGDKEPADWLAARWAARFPELPSLADLQHEGRLVLLLDGLNEMPHANDREYRALIGRWRRYLAEVAADSPGSRVVFACRTLDYSAPLSTGVLRVPQVVVQPMDDAAVRGFLKAYCPVQAESVWMAMADGELGDVVRTPYLLALIANQAVVEGQVPTGTAALFTGFVRSALQREVERENPRFEPGGVLTAGDYRRLVQRVAWPTPYDLPNEGALEAGLRRLAFEMQLSRPEQGGQGGEVRLPAHQATALLDGAQANEVLQAGMDLGVVVEDIATAEVQFGHQLLQEYFAAREVARAPRPELTRVAWRAEEMRPSLAETVAALAPPDPLPPAPGTGWEETTVLAAAMSPEPVRLVQALMGENLVLAGRCAAVPEVRRQLPDGLLDELRWALVARSRDPEADLRARIAAGLALGDLGDPRFERRVGPYGAYMLPPFVEIPGGLYTIGSDDGIYPEEEEPVHQLEIAAFKLAVFPVTNAEWALFMKAGGYEDERWWTTESGEILKLGELMAEASRWNARLLRRQRLANPGQLEQEFQQGIIALDRYQEIRQRLGMSDLDFEVYLTERFPSSQIAVPQHWHDAAFNQTLQPVVGISWYEARAYVLWLSMQSGLDLRLPTEVEWESAARGAGALRFAFGEAFDAGHCNTWATHMRRTTPVGVFPGGDTSTGLMDVTGNVNEWTESVFRLSADDPPFYYPYDASDGREAAVNSPRAVRVARGGSWTQQEQDVRCTVRFWNALGVRYDNLGMRLLQTA